MSDDGNWSGSLQPKKKSDLAQLAAEFGLEFDSSDTRPALIELIKSHLSHNESTLLEDPRYQGLFGRRGHRGSAAPVATDNDSDDSSGAAVVPASKPASRRRMLKPDARPPSPAVSLSRAAVTRNFDFSGPDTPTKVPLPASPARSVMSDMTARLRPEVELIVSNAVASTEQLKQENVETVAWTKNFISNSHNIVSITVLWEFMTLLYYFEPWESWVVHLGNVTLHFPHPPSSLVTSWAFPSILFFWALSTIIIPVIAGLFVSFQDRADADPLSLGIVRLACVSLSTWGVPESALSVRQRTVSAATALAFAVAEALVDRGDRAEIQRLLD